MTTETARQQIYRLIEKLPDEQLPGILKFLERLLKNTGPATIAETPPIYQIHHQAISTGITDLAHQHDHYLYGSEKKANG